MTIIMVMSNKCFRCQPQTTVLTNQKHNIKIQSVQLNHSVLSTILLCIVNSSGSNEPIQFLRFTGVLGLFL